MIAYEHRTAECPDCGQSLWYGVKPEGKRWKVWYQCPPPEGCKFESFVGRISKNEARTSTAALECAADMW